jgi:hypothetical protein
VAPAGRPLLYLNHHVHAVAQPRCPRRHTSSPTLSESDWASQVASAWPPHPHCRSLLDQSRSVQAAAASWHEEAGDRTQHAPSVRGRARVRFDACREETRGAPILLRRASRDGRLRYGHSRHSRKCGAAPGTSCRSRGGGNQKDPHGWIRLGPVAARAFGGLGEHNTSTSRKQHTLMSGTTSRRAKVP